MTYEYDAGNLREDKVEELFRQYMKIISFNHEKVLEDVPHRQ